MQQTARAAQHSKKGSLPSGKALIFPVIVFSSAVNLLLLTGPVFMLQIYDRVLSTGSEETLVVLFALVIALYGLMGLIDYARGRLIAQMGLRLRSRWDVRAFRSGMATPRADETSPLTLQQLDHVQSAFSAPVAASLLDIPWSAMFLAMLFLFHPALGWVGIAGVSGLLALAWINNLLGRRAAAAAQRDAREARKWATLSHAQCDFVTSQGMTQAMQARWHRPHLASLHHRSIVGATTGAAAAASKAFRLLLQSASLAMGAWLVLRSELSAGAMIAASIMLGRALAPIEQCISQWPVIARAWAAWQVLRVLGASDAEQAARQTVSGPAANLQVLKVTVRAPHGWAPVLSNIRFEIAPGEIVGVIGPNGSGKSSLAQLAVGILPPALGEVRLSGARLSRWPSDQRSEMIGYMPQDIAFFDGTVAENIALMAGDMNQESVVQAALWAGAHQVILGLGDGYETLLNWAGSGLSNGQRRKIALARALYRAPPVLVLDEPCAVQDAAGLVALSDVLNAQRARGCSALVTTHRRSVLQACDRVIVLSGGSIVAQGPRDQVLAESVASTFQHPVTRAAG